jgi:uncharacterized membrane protein
MSYPQGRQLKLKEVIWKDATALWSAIFLSITLFFTFLASTTGIMIVSRGSRYSTSSPEEYTMIGIILAGICAVTLVYRVIMLLRFCQNVLEIDGYVTAMTVEAGGINHTYEYKVGQETYTRTFLRKRQYLKGTRILVFVNPSRPHKPIVAE